MWYHYSMLGHSVERCYKLYVYSKGHKLNGKIEVSSFIQVLTSSMVRETRTAKQVVITQKQYAQMMALLQQNNSSTHMIPSFCKNNNILGLSDISLCHNIYTIESKEWGIVS